MFGFLKKRFKGAAVLETALTLPIIMYLIFAAIEMIRIGLAQVAVDSMAKECGLSLMGRGNALDFTNIISKYRPISIPIDNFRFYVRVYENLDSMMAAAPYGGEAVGWPGSDFAAPSAADPYTYANNRSFGLLSTDPMISKYGTTICNGSAYGEVGDSLRKTILSGGSTLDRPTKPFVLTVVVKFPFSSAFVAKLFAGGKNTNKQDVFLLWSRVSGMINSDL